MKKWLFILPLIFFILGISHAVYAEEIMGIPAFTTAAAANGGTTYSLSLKILALMTLLTLLPALLMTMTCFTRVIIVLALLRQAIGLPSIPSNQILTGLALFLTLFIMAPVLQKINVQAIQPYMNKSITEQEAFTRASIPLSDFMLKQMRKDDMALFLKLAKKPANTPAQQIPFYILMPAYLTSELKTAFQIGFLLFLPFLIIDLVVASVLMSMGMMMLTPTLISLPFKIMLFVLVNGWVLIIGTLASSFGTIT